VKGEEFVGFFEKQGVLGRLNKKMLDTDHKHAISYEIAWM